MSILGLDLSLTETGYYTLTTSPACGCGTFRTVLRGVKRLEWLRNRLYSLIALTAPKMVIIEGYAFMANGRTFNIGEWGGIARLCLYENNIPYMIVAPTILKKYATGKGNAKKEQVIQAVKEKWGLDFENDNEADAFVLWRIGKAIQDGEQNELFEKVKHNPENFGGK